jgi:hypothetical protein
MPLHPALTAPITADDVTSVMAAAGKPVMSLKPDAVAAYLNNWGADAVQAAGINGDYWVGADISAFLAEQSIASAHPSAKAA